MKVPDPETSPSIAAIVRRAVLWLVVCVAGACATRPAPVASTASRDLLPAPPRARLLGAFAVAAGVLPAVDGLAAGSFSALAYDAATTRWAVASDEVLTPRLIWLTIGLGPALSVTPVATTRLRLAPDVPADTLTVLDMEGLAFLPDGSFAVSHEGHFDRTQTARQPRVLIATRAGLVTQVVSPRPHFAMDASNRTTGVRHNLGLESLTLTPDGRLVSALEQPLAQDGPVSGAARGGLTRILEFVRNEAGRWVPGREWAYRLEPTPQVAGYDRVCEDGQNGLSELLALTDTTLLAVERACLFGTPGAPAYNPVRLYEVRLDGADDVSAEASLEGRNPVTATKRLVVDLATWRRHLPPILSTASNIEGMAFGPPGPKGERTVMLVSDDNFRASQTTAFIWLALE